MIVSWFFFWQILSIRFYAKWPSLLLQDIPRLGKNDLRDDIKNRFCEAIALFLLVAIIRKPHSYGGIDCGAVLRVFLRVKKSPIVYAVYIIPL